MEMVDALSEAWTVLQEAMGSSGLRDRPKSDLLHAVEAAAWLERVAEAGRHLLVPIAKVNGASWADLAAAMGVSRATAQHRHGQDVAEWEEDMQEAARWALARDVEPLAPMDPPEEFQPSEHDLARMAGLPAWNYIGPLAPGIQFIRAHHTDVRYYAYEGVHYVSSKHTRDDGIPSSVSTSADSEEEAWRAHIGGALSEGMPYPDDARPGETVAQLRARVM